MELWVLTIPRGNDHRLSERNSISVHYEESDLTSAS